VSTLPVVSLDAGGRHAVRDRRGIHQAMIVYRAATSTGSSAGHRGGVRDQLVGGRQRVTK
jgi:hypothetical protein